MITATTHKSFNFNSLSEELIVDTFSLLKPAEKATAAKVCRLWNLCFKKLLLKDFKAGKSLSAKKLSLLIELPGNSPDLCYNIALKFRKDFEDKSYGDKYFMCESLKNFSISQSLLISLLHTFQSNPIPSKHVGSTNVTCPSCESA
jgi:hypothetical protein